MINEKGAHNTTGPLKPEFQKFTACLWSGSYYSTENSHSIFMK